MIRLVTEENREAAERIALPPCFTVKILALLKAYGTNQRFFEAWVQNGRSLIARLDNAFLVAAAPGADVGEMAAFLGFGPAVRTVYGEERAVRKLSRLVPFRELAVWNLLMRKPDDVRFFPDAEMPAEKSPELRDVLAVLQDGGLLGAEDDGRLYADLSHRIRHGCARAYLVMKEKPVSCCLVGAESDGAGLISGVATVPGCRGRGYASALVRMACGDLMRSGKLPLLECSDELLPMYLRLGFERAGRAAQMRL